jgi:hypothetical protein
VQVKEAASSFTVKCEIRYNTLVACRILPSTIAILLCWLSAAPCAVKRSVPH